MDGIFELLKENEDMKRNWEDENVHRNKKAGVKNKKLATEKVRSYKGKDCSREGL